jgi:DNA-binding IclR family transcriptional regulator
MRKRNNASTESPHSFERGGERLPVSSINRAASILVCLGKGINNVTDIADCCKLSKSTVHRLLNTLKGPRLTVYDSLNHRYYLGPLITQLAANSEATHQYLIMCAADEMQHLSDVAEETITLNIMVGLQFIHLYDIRSKHGLKVEEDADIIPVLPFGSVQKALLSQLNEKELALALKNIKTWSNKNHQATDIDQLKKELEQIKQQGYAFSCGERIPGGIGISAPVKNYFCPVVLSILGPETRIQPNVPQLTVELIASAGRLSENIAAFFQ